MNLHGDGDASTSALDRNSSRARDLDRPCHANTPRNTTQVTSTCPNGFFGTRTPNVNVVVHFLSLFPRRCQPVNQQVSLLYDDLLLCRRALNESDCDCARVNRDREREISLLVLSLSRSVVHGLLGLAAWNLPPAEDNSLFDEHASLFNEQDNRDSMSINTT